MEWAKPRDLLESRGFCDMKPEKLLFVYNDI